MRRRQRDPSTQGRQETTLALRHFSPRDSRRMVSGMSAGGDRTPPRSRWSSFVADPEQPRPRVLYEQGNPAHRLRVEHDKTTLLIHLSGEDGEGWTVLAVDRATRRCVLGQARRQLDAAKDAYSRLYDA
jgi:hypothetical protein